MRVFAPVLTAFTLAAIALLTPTGSARALEPGAHPPYLQGATGGVPIGVLPPPAFYVSSLTSYLHGVLHADNPPKDPPTLSSFAETLTVLSRSRPPSPCSRRETRRSLSTRPAPPGCQRAWSRG